jgi:pyridoxal/pyridoxine/pyridoxamine kinase
MITNEQELTATQARIEQFQRWLAQIRHTARAEEFEAVASGYRLEIERMQAEVMEYLMRPPVVERHPQPAYNE